MYHSLRIEPLGISLIVNHGERLTDVLRTYGVEFPCGGKGLCGNCKVRILSGVVEKTAAHKELLERKKLYDNWCLACFAYVEDDLTIEIPYGEMSVQTDNDDVCPGNIENGFAVSVDLGSTTVVVQLINLETGSVLCTKTGLNPQSAYGTDIISRVSYSMTSKECRDIMTGVIRNYIGSQINSIISDFPDIQIKRIRMVGNTVMHHLFIGHDVSCLARAPFQSEHNSNFIFSPDELGWNIASDCDVEFLPNISHFVGSDILAGIISCGMYNSEKYLLLVDLGTNGEIVLGNKTRMWCTSTAAGPAFEGINISCGMRASTGAISEVEYKDDKFEVSTIGGVNPLGLCGSGLVEAIYTLLENDMIDCMGNILSDNHEGFELAEGVKLMPEDIREFQLAKAAIAAGVQLLVKYSSISVDDISCVYITGGLGNYINFSKIIRLGLIPGIGIDKFCRMSNAALSGCKMLLFKSEYNKIGNILDRMCYCPLESDSDFMDFYCNNMYFPIE